MDEKKKKRAEYYQKNADRLRKIQAEYYRKNSDNVLKRKAEYRRKNRDKVLKMGAEYRRKNRDKVREMYRKWMCKNADKFRKMQVEYYRRNADKVRKKNAEYRRKNPDKVRKMRSEYGSKIEVRIVKRQRGRLKHIVGSTSVSRHEMTGCTPNELRDHIESQFVKGMTWENQGRWHIDHIIPCSAFDLTKPDQVKICFNWQNLRPIWAKKNLSKGKKITHPQLPLPLGIVANIEQT